VTNLRDGHGANIKRRPFAGKERYGTFDAELTFRQGPGSSVLFIEAHKRPFSDRLRNRLAKTDVAAWTADLVKEGRTPPEIDAAVQRFRRVLELGVDALPRS
jgi:hypothetical protein